MTAYHLLIDGRQIGPFEHDVIVGMIARGEVTRGTRVRTPGGNAWQVAVSVDELRDHFSSAAFAGEFQHSEPMSEAEIGPAGRLRTGHAVDSTAAAFARNPLGIAALAAPFAAVGFAVSVAGLAYSASLFKTFLATIRFDPGFTWAIPVAMAAVVAAMLFGGVNAAMLDTVRGQPIRFSRLFSGTARFSALLQVAAASAILAVLAGFAVIKLVPLSSLLLIFLFVPVMAPPLLLYFAVFLIVDARQGGIQSMRNSLFMVRRLGWIRVIGGVIFVSVFCFLALVLFD